MAHHDDDGATKTEHGADLTVEDAAGLGSGFSLDIDTLIVERYIMQTLYIILSEVADNAVGTCDRNGQTTAVALEATADAQVLRRRQQRLLSLSRSFFLPTGILLGLSMLHGTATGFLAGFLGLSSSCLSFRFLTGFLGSLTSLSSSTFSGSLSFRTTLGLSSSTCLLAGHFLSD